jgi:protein TonB
MRRDLIIGLLASVLIHGGLAFGFNRKAAPPPPPPPPPTIEVIAAPPLEPDEPPPPVESSEQVADEPAPAAPMQADLPSVALDTPFVQNIQPPPPPDLGRPAGMITIPTSRPVAGQAAAAGLKQIFELADLDQHPSPRLNARPEYPAEMRRNRVSGEVQVGFVIDPDGNARDPRVLRSTHREFEASALDAVLRSKFNAGKKGGRFVSTRVTRTIKFDVPSGNE